MSWSLDEYEKQNGAFKPMDATPEPVQGWGSRLGAGFDRAQAQVIGVAESAGDEFGLDTSNLTRRRLANTASADAVTEQFNRQKGAPGSMDEVDWTSPRSVGLYAGGMAADTAPQLGAILGASLINPTLGLATAYGAAVGDITENQREASGGHTDLLAAGVGAVPYVAAEKAFGGLESMAMKRQLTRSGVKALDKIEGLPGAAARTGANVARTAVGGGVGETAQEMVNTGFGRMAVSDKEEMFSPEAMGRYGESFVGGALLESVGGIPGGHRRSEGYVPPPAKGATPIGEKGTMGESLTDYGDKSILDPTNRNKINEGILDYGRSQGGGFPPSPAGPAPSILDPTERNKVNGELLDHGRAMGLINGRTVGGDSILPAQAAGAVNETFGGPVASQIEGMQPPTPAQQDKADTIADSKSHAESIQKLEGRAAEHGVDPKNALLFGALEGALQNKLIDRPSFVVGVGNLASGNKQLIADTKKAIAALEAQHEIEQRAKAAAPEAAAAPAGGLQLAPAVPPAGTAAPEAPAGAQAPTPAPVEAAAQRAVSEVKERLSPGKVITAAAMKKKGGKPISPLLRRRLYQRMGLDDAGWPRAEKRTLAEIAQIEADEKGEGKLEGKKLEQKARAIQTMLAGHGFPAKVIDDAIDAMTDQGHGLDTRSIAVEPGAELTAEQMEGTGAETSTPQMAEGADIEDQTDFDEGSAPAERKTTEELEADEEAGEDYAGTGMGVKSSATSTADRENTVAYEFRNLARDLAKAPDLTDAQRELFANAANLPWKQRVEAINELIANEELFSAPEREMLDFVFAEGRSRAAEEARDETVEEAREIAESAGGAAEEALAARNIEVIAKNAREDAAKAQRAASLARQVEEMDAGEALLEAVPADMHEDIEGAAKEWEEYAMEGAPPWHGLATDLQAQWVKGFSASLDMVPQRSQEQRVAVSEAVSRRAIGRQESAAAAADRAAADTDRAIAAAAQREELRGLATQQEAEEKAKAERKASRTVGTTTVRTKRRKINAQDTQADGGTGGTVADVGQGTEGTREGSPARSEGRHGAPDERPAAEGTGVVDQARGEAQEPTEGPADSDVDEHGDWTTVATQAPLMATPPAARKPSVRVELRRANKAVERGTITEAEALERVTEAAAQASEMEREGKSQAQLVRDADHTRAQLLEGRRTGELDPDLVELADWFIRKNPQFVNGLAISTKSPKKDKRGNELPGPAGTYESMRRIMTLIKGRANTLTAVHEILHHTERMMPRPMREALTKAWIKALFLAKRKADAGTDENLKKFFDALMYYHFDAASRYGAKHPSTALKDAMELLTSGKVSANAYYQFTNSSEFWAVNGSRIVQGRFMGSEGWQHKIKAWMREFVQKLKAMVGMQSDAPIIRALDSIAKGDGRFVTGSMLSEGSGVGGVHNMYVGPEAADQEKKAQLATAERNEANGLSPATIYTGTGWFRNPFDKEWRYEVPDNGAYYKTPLKDLKLGEGKYKLSDILSHDVLYRLYPDLKDVPVHIYEGGPMSHADGFYSPIDNSIGLNRKPQTDSLDTMIHEIQHWVQEKEGFNTGASTADIASHMTDEQAVKVGKQVANENYKKLAAARKSERRVHDFMSHPLFPQVIEANKQARADMNNAMGYQGKSSLPNDKAVASIAYANELTERVVYETQGMELDAMVGMPAYADILNIVQADTASMGWAMLDNIKRYNDQHEADIEQAALGNREQITRLGYNSRALYAAYRRSAGEMEAEETAMKRNMDEDYRMYFAPFPMSTTGVEPADAIVNRERMTGPAAREMSYDDEIAQRNKLRSDAAAKAMADEKVSRRNFLLGMSATTASVVGGGYVLRDQSTIGKAAALSRDVIKKRISPAAEKLLRAGQRGGTTNIDGTSALRAALMQMAKDHPELSGLIDRVRNFMPERGMMLTVDDTRLMNAHGAVTMSAVPHLQLFTAEGREGLTVGTILHELLHAGAIARYSTLSEGLVWENYLKSDLNQPKAKAALDDFKKVWEEFKDAARSERRAFEKLDEQTKLSISEASHSPDEFFVRALTDPELQKWMSEREYKGRRLLDRFKEWVSSVLFGMGTRGVRPSWLDAALEASEKVTEKGLADKGDWKTFNAMQNYERSGKGPMIPAGLSEKTLYSIIDNHVSKLPPKLQPGAKFGLRTVLNSANRVLSNVTSTEDLTRIVEIAMPAARRYVDQMRAIVFERQDRQTATERLLLDVKKLAPGQAEKASNFMRDSTLAKKWGYKPGYVADVVPDPAMEKRFNALLPETQKAVKQAFEAGHKDLVDRRKAVVEMADVAHGGDEAARSAAIAKYDRLMGMSGEWPYVPLSRYGDFTAVGRSAAFRDVEERLKQDPKNKALREQYDAMEQNPAHYEVQFGQTEAHAQAIADDMRGRFPTENVEHFERDKTQVMGAGSDMFAAVARLRNLAADSEFSETSTRTLNRLINDMHLSLLSERSARQSDRARKGIAGFHDDMWRNIGSRSKANAHFIAATRGMGTVQNHLAALKREANAPGVVEGMDRATRTKHYNEFLRRHMAEMEWKPNAFVDNGLAMTSIWKLLTSPGYLAVNLTQPWLMSAPVIAGRHQIGATIAAFGKAYKDIAPLVKGNQLSPGLFQNMPSDVQAGIDALVKRGLISISLDMEHGAFGEGDNPVTKGLKMSSDFVKGLSTKTEDINRVVTAIAALRLERARGSTPEAAIKYAEKVLYDTHGDYSGFNAPPIMRTTLGRFVFQFRKFQMIQVALWFKMARDAFIGKGLTADERWAAKKSLAYSLGTMGVFAGAVGLPGAQVIALGLGAVFGDDDEPNNPELAMRKWIGDDNLADLILKGVPAALGLDLSSRLGAGDILSLIPRSDPEFTAAGYERTVFKALGPAVGMGEDLVVGMGLVFNGDYWKGLEKMAPRGIADISKGARLAMQGFTNKAGEVTVKSDDIGLFDAAMQAVGLPTTVLSDRSTRASNKYTQDKFYTARQAEVKKEYVDAYLAGNHDRVQEAREDWTRLQAGRKRLGYKPEPLSTLIKAPGERAKRERQTIGGVQYRGQRDRGAAQVLSEL